MPCGQTPRVGPRAHTLAHATRRYNTAQRFPTDQNHPGPATAKRSLHNRLAGLKRSARRAGTNEMLTRGRSRLCGMRRRPSLIPIRVSSPSRALGQPGRRSELDESRRVAQPPMSNSCRGIAAHATTASPRVSWDSRSLERGARPAGVGTIAYPFGDRYSSLSPWRRPIARRGELRSAPWPGRLSPGSRETGEPQDGNVGLAPQPLRHVSAAYRSASLFFFRIRGGNGRAARGRSRPGWRSRRR
jgi:hypothetical protein